MSLQHRLNALKRVIDAMPDVDKELQVKQTAAKAITLMDLCEGTTDLSGAEDHWRRQVERLGLRLTDSLPVDVTEEFRLLGEPEPQQVEASMYDFE